VHVRIDRPALICAPGDHDWEYIDAGDLRADENPDDSEKETLSPDSAVVPTHRCRRCQVMGMMEILNDGRSQAAP
jgi:hypothetical protein